MSYTLNPVPIPIMTPYSRSVCADVDGDLMFDLAVLVAGEVRLLFSPGLFEAPLAGLQYNVHDLTRVTRRSELGRDALVTAGQLGLRRAVWLGDGIDWVSIHPRASKRLRQLNTLPGHPRKIVSLAADQINVFLLTENLADPNGVWDEQFYFRSETPVLDLRVADLGGDGVQEVCLLKLHGLQAVQAGVSVMEVNYPTVDTTAITVVGERGGEQWLACTIVNPLNGDEVIAVFDENGLIDVEFVGGGPGFVGLTTGDPGGAEDAQPDIAVTYSSDYHVAHVINLAAPGSDPVFDIYADEGLEIVEVPDPPALVPHAAWPSLADFDNDADDDTLLPVTADGSVYVYLSDKIKESALKPMILQDGSLAFRARDTIELEMTVALDPSHLGDSADALEILAYRRLDPASPVLTEPEVVELIGFDEGAGVGSSLHFSCSIPLAETPGDQNCTAFDSMYFIVVRMVGRELDSAAKAYVARRHPARLYAIQGQVDTNENHNFIVAHVPGVESLVIPHGCVATGESHVLFEPPYVHDPSTASAAGQTGGSGTELPCLPGPMDDGVVPKPDKGS